MGCTLCAEDHFSPEGYLREQEKRLSISHHPTTKTNLLIRKTASRDTLNKRQFNYIVEELRTSSAKSLDSRKASLYMSSVLLNRGLCNRYEILVMGCLYGQGTAQERYRVLFEVCDVDFKGEISYQDALLLARAMVHVSIDTLPNLVDIEGMDRRQVSEMKDYINSLQQTSEVVSIALVKALFPDKRGKCSLNLGLEGLEDLEIATLMRPEGIRGLAKGWIAKIQSKNKTGRKQGHKRSSSQNLALQRL